MGVIARITTRLLLGSRRSVLIGLVMLIPVLIAIAFHFGKQRGDDPIEFARDVVGDLILTTLLPLVALVLGTTALGSEIEDGTAVFLLSKPLARWKIVVVKAAVAACATAAVCVPATIASVWIAAGSASDGGLVPGYAIAALVASVMYGVLFTVLSVLTQRSLIIGLAYVFVWETILASVFEGVAWLSVHQYSLGWAATVISLDDFDPRLSVGGAVVASVVVAAIALWLGSRKLTRFEIGERA